jgi:hypothetical protein
VYCIVDVKRKTSSKIRTLQVCNQVYEQFYDDNGIFKIDSLDEFGLFGEGMKRSEREIRSYR